MNAGLRTKLFTLTLIGLTLSAILIARTVDGKFFDTPASFQPVKLASQPANPNLDVAMVLDTTGSMEGGKLAAMQEAATSFIDALAPHGTGVVKFSIVPFSQYVNIGVANEKAGWLRAEQEKEQPLYSCKMTLPVISQRNCETVTYTDVHDGIPFTYTEAQCDTDFGQPQTQCSEGPQPIHWQGCAGSPNYPADTGIMEGYTAIPALPRVTCGAEVLPLTSNVTEVKLKLHSLLASGETYIPSGLFWGLATLTGMPALADAAIQSGEVQQKTARRILILMTDGGNTRSANYPDHEGKDVAAANRMTKELCTNIKAKGIPLYTVSFGDVPQDVNSLLTACASSTDNHFEALDSPSLGSVFKKLAVQLR